MLDRKLEEYKVQNSDLINANDYTCEYCTHNEQNIVKRKYKVQTITDDFVHQKTELITFNNINLLSWNVENYAVLLILYKKFQDSCYSEYVTEVDLLSEIEELCGFATKTSILDLVEKNLISMISDHEPIRYNLTEHGINISRKICEVTSIDAKSINSFEILNKIQTFLETLIIENLGLPTNNSNENIKRECSKNIQNKDLNLEFPTNKLNIDNTKIQKECFKSIQDKDSNNFSKIYKSKSAECIIIKNHREKSDKNFEKQIKKYDLIENVQEKTKNLQDKNHVDNLENKTDSIDNFQKNVYLESNKFDIILLVDTQEISGGKTKPQHDDTIKELTQLDVLFEIRHLKIGDFAWIARCRRKKIELILPYIVERKRIDDLNASIIDGRFHEQKYRLKQSGITNLIYIIEDHEKSQKLTIPYSSLMQASINTLIQDDFSLKYTKSHKDSMFYLSSLTRILIKTFKDKNLIGCKKEIIKETNVKLLPSNISNNIYNLMEFEEFNKAASKHKVFKVNEMFIRQLLQLKGMSVDKALAIVEHYPTPRLLIDALHTPDCNGELLLANIQFGNRKRLIGSAISKTIYQLYTKKHFN
ncbi:crossover junction endonuclease MUS81 isoform X2 [Apis dorsata]|nr:crossover junction endonuclease MUS81 isoform X2 [Apis dorsata]